jgi:outer membrane protein assembly factor BamB
MSNVKKTGSYFLLLLFLFSCKKNDVDNTNNLPEIATLNVTAVTSNSASSGGSITKNGGSAVSEKGICFGITPSPSIVNTKIIATSASDTFTVDISSLQPNTIYYVRAYAKNGSGVSYGNEINFQTSTATTTYIDTATTMYVSGGYSKKLFALNASDGSIKWAVTLGGDVMSSPIYDKGMVFVGCANNKLYAYDTTGNLKWTANTGIVSHECPVVSNGIVYFPDRDAINAFNANTGSLVWRYLGGGGNMVLKNNVIYTNNGQLYAIDAVTGLKKWQYHTASILQPIVCDDRIYVTNHSMSYSLNVISTSTGALLWGKENFGIFVDLIGLNIKNGNLYCITSGGANAATSGTNGLNILDSATANVKFPTTRFNVFQTYSDNISPLFIDSLAFIPTENSISAYNAVNGQWIYTIPGGSTNCGITIANNLLYFTQGNRFIQDPIYGGGYYAGFVCVFDYKTRTMKWSKEFRETNFLWASPCIVTRSGKVYRSGTVSQ